MSVTINNAKSANIPPRLFYIFMSIVKKVLQLIELYVPPPTSPHIPVFPTMHDVINEYLCLRKNRDNLNSFKKIC